MLYCRVVLPEMTRWLDSSAKMPTSPQRSATITKFASAATLPSAVEVSAVCQGR